MLFKASAPGSLMLLGEYAVLHGKQALVCAINKRMTVSLEPRTDKIIKISSDRFDEFTTSISKLIIERPYPFILAIFKKYQKHLSVGFNLTIKSEFSDQVGFASSAAVTVATLAVLDAWLDFKFPPQKLIQEARSIVQKVQGLGSGADVAACVLGGVVAYKMKPLTAEKITTTFPISVIYSGYKTTTVEAVSRMKKKYVEIPKLYNHIFSAMDVCAQQASEAIKNQQWEKLGNIMNINQGLLEALDVSTPELNDIIVFLRAQKNMLGAKISGSGLGDCAIGVGASVSIRALPFGDSRIKYIPTELTLEGVVCEKI